MRLTALTALIVCAALLAGGCGGGDSGGSNSTAPRAGGTPKKATAPNAPAGSEVVACKIGAITAMTGLRATAVDCGTARRTMRDWQGRACALAEGASRGSCSVDGFRCQAVKADHAYAVSCAQSDGDISFIAKVWPIKKNDSG